MKISVCLTNTIRLDPIVSGIALFNIITDIWGIVIIVCFITGNDGAYDLTRTLNVFPNSFADAETSLITITLAVAISLMC